MDAMIKFFNWIDSLEDDPNTPPMILIATLLCKGIGFGLFCFAMMMVILGFIMYVPGGLLTLSGLIFVVCFGIVIHHYKKETNG